MQHTNTHDGRTGAVQSPHRGAQVGEVIDGELCEGAPYSGAQLAQELAIAESTLRTRWLPWLEKVAPLELLRTDLGYTELARSLAQEFKQVPSKKAAREQWVSDAKHRYAPEWSSVGLIDGELMPEEVGNALALIQTQGSTLETTYRQEMADIQAFVEQLNTAEDDFSEAELQRFKAQGALRGVKRFKVETQAELSTYNALRHQRMQGTGES